MLCHLSTGRAALGEAHFSLKRGKKRWAGLTQVKAHTRWILKAQVIYALQVSSLGLMSYDTQNVIYLPRAVLAVCCVPRNQG